MLVAKKICDELDDLQIVQRSLREVDYFSCLYERYEARLLKYIKSIAGMDDDEAEDVLQEAFIKIWKNLHAFDQRLKLSSWVYRIVHNEAISVLRKKHSYGKDARLAWDDATLAKVADEPLREAEQLDENYAKLIRETLEQLPLPYQEVLALRYMESMSYEEISDVLKIPEGTVAARINRAKKAFAKIASKHVSILSR